MRRLTVLIACLWLRPNFALSEDVDYVKQIKPILSARCYSCHSALRKKSGLRLDTAVGLVTGGESGPAVVPRKAADSLLITMLTGESGTRMPPENDGAALTAEQIELVKKWIDEGAHAPAETPAPDPRDHWSYKPPVRPSAPKVRDAGWVRNPVDAFIAADHESHGLSPAAAASKSTLLRRVYLDLIGLPPRRDELEAFLNNNSSNAYEEVVDRLLASPQYGERWGRHWMDVWRYSDWAGYKEEIRNSARHIWRWRDWIIESLNADKGYDRMATEMLAGDEVAPADPGTLRATGFLVRNWEKFNRNTWMETTIEHTAKAFLGATMNCCRCHDHKFDPISQVEYYQFRAIFEPHEVRTERVPGEPDAAKDGLARVCDLTSDAPTYVFERGDEKRPKKDKVIKPGVPEAFGGSPLQIQPIELPALAYYPALQEFAINEELAKQSATIVQAEAALAKARTAIALAKTKKDEKSLPGLVVAAELALKQVATARAARTCYEARVAAEKAKYGLTRTGVQQLAQAAAKLERELALCQAQEQQAAVAHELAVARNALKPDDPKSANAVAAAEQKVAASTLAVGAAHLALALPSTEYAPLGEQLPHKSTGRRLAFAKWLVDRRNPLAARVAVNHIWLRHFGAPLVDNTFDFGLRSSQPRNQQLLDWLAAELMDHNWQMKHIHRLLVTSNTFRMSSSSAGASAADLATDSDNRFLWRMNSHRLEAESVRDSIFYTAGNLDLTRGGPDLAFALGAATPRRSIYFQHAYEKENKFLEIFDSASVNECYRRSESIVPQQALAMANSDLTLNESRMLAREMSDVAAKSRDGNRAFVRLAYEHILSREPTSTELTECELFVASQSEMLQHRAHLTAVVGGPKATVAGATDPVQRARENLTVVLYNHNDFVTVH